MRPQCAHVDDAEHLAARDERRAQKGLDALLAQDRIEDIRVVDVREHDRALLGSDAAGKSPADRDADALLHLLLDASCGPRDELRAGLVEQQDRARVDLDRVPNSVDELLKQIAEAHRRERGVRDRLKPLEGFCRPLGLPVHAAVIDRVRGAVGRELQKLRVVAREIPWGQRADVQDAEDVAADEERHPQERLDSLLTQDRVEHVGVVDVLNDHRMSVRRDPAGETLPDRDANTLFHLLLDAPRRAGDELVARLVEKEERTGVRFQSLSDPLEERLQELVEVEVRKGSVGDRLDAKQPLVDIAAGRRASGRIIGHAPELSDRTR